MHLAPGNCAPERSSPVWEFDTEVSKIIQCTPSIKAFRFPVRGKGVRYQPGQFFFVTIKVLGEDGIHHFSFSSSPTDRGYIEFAKRITASDYSQALNAMTPGAWAHLRGPNGSFTLQPTPRRLAFLSGGIGITPLRSMLRYKFDKKLPYDVVPLYSYNSYEDITYREDLDATPAAGSGVRVEYVLSGPDFPPGWKGKTGFINKDVVRELVPDFAERLFYISGPPRMVIALEEQLTGLPVPDKQTKRDSFTGYD